MNSTQTYVNPNSSTIPLVPNNQPVSVFKTSNVQPVITSQPVQAVITSQPQRNSQFKTSTSQVQQVSNDARFVNYHNNEYKYNLFSFID